MQILFEWKTRLKTHATCGKKTLGTVRPFGVLRAIHSFGLKLKVVAGSTRVGYRGYIKLQRDWSDGPTHAHRREPMISFLISVSIMDRAMFPRR